MESSAQDGSGDADFSVSSTGVGAVPRDLPVVHPTYALVGIEDYRNLIRRPTSVLNDGLYGLLEALPGHPLLWALLFGVGLLMPNALFDESVSSIGHVRTYTEVHASYFFLPVLLVQVLVMPVFYQAILKCFDSLRYAMNASEFVLNEKREMLVNPARDMQWKLLGAILLVCLVSEEYSSARFSRFSAGEWDAYDIWLTFANTATLTLFLWYLLIPIGRTLLLSKFLGETVSPRLFDDSLGEPVATFGLRAGLLFAIPYFFVGSFAPVILSDSWTYLLPGLIGTVTAIGFAVVPAVPLRKVRRRLKRDEVEKVNAAVARITIDEPGKDLPVDRLSEIVTLLEYGREVKALREWPFEARMFRSFSLYFLLIPMTWVGAALVEMIVEQFAAF